MVGIPLAVTTITDNSPFEVDHENCDKFHRLILKREELTVHCSHSLTVKDAQAASRDYLTHSECVALGTRGPDSATVSLFLSPQFSFTRIFTLVLIHFYSTSTIYYLFIFNVIFGYCDAEPASQTYRISLHSHIMTIKTT